jgi:hypothetical protein
MYDDLDKDNVPSEYETKLITVDKKEAMNLYLNSL